MSTKDFININKKYAAKPYSFLVDDYFLDDDTISFNR